MLCIDLTTESTVITGNRTKATTPSEPQEADDIPAQALAPDSPTDHA